MLLAEQCEVAVQALKEAVDGGLEMLEVLVHEPQVEVESSDVGVVLAGGHLEDGEGSVHVLKGAREVAARMVVEC